MYATFDELVENESYRATQSSGATLAGYDDPVEEMSEAKALVYSFFRQQLRRHPSTKEAKALTYSFFRQQLRRQPPTKFAGTIIFKDRAPTNEEVRSPFEVLDDRADNTTKILEIVSHIRRLEDLGFSDRLARRIEELSEASADDPEDTDILPESVSFFVGFLLSAQQQIRYPDLTVSPDGHLRAEWRRAPNRHFAVQFLENGAARTVVFLPSSKHPEKVNRFAGTVTVDELWNTIEMYGAEDWMLKREEPEHG